MNNRSLFKIYTEKNRFRSISAVFNLAEVWGGGASAFKKALKPTLVLIGWGRQGSVHLYKRIQKVTANLLTVGKKCK